MDFKIVHAVPGRIRLNFGRGKLTRGQGYALENRLSELPFVRAVETNVRTGSLLVHFDKGMRNALLDYVSTLPTKNLHEDSISETSRSRELTREFRNDISKKVLGWLGRKMLLPMPVRTALALCEYSGYIVCGLKSLAGRKIDVPVLDMVSIGAALATGDVPTAGNVMFMLSISEALEDYTRKKTRGALTESLALNVDLVWRRSRNGSEEQVPYSALAVDDIVIVRSGSVIPVDGTVLCGNAEVNEASMTGESVPRHKDTGKTVYAGTTVESGKIDVRVDAVHSDTRLSRIVKLIDRSEKFKAQLQSRAEELADRIVPYSLGAAAIVYALTQNTTRAVSVLMVDFSCALKLATPIAVISAMREAATHKIAVKGGKFLEAFARADTIVFDKTGTLTTSSPRVAHVIAMPGFDEDFVLKTAACLEEHFPHSVARAIVDYARERNLPHLGEDHAEVEYVVAHGISSFVNGTPAKIGSYHFIAEDAKIPIPDAAYEALEGVAARTSNIYLSIGNELAGIIAVEDPPRKEAAEAISMLRDAGIKHVVMLTGDGEHAASAVARRLGIDDYRAHILPEDKAKIVSEIKAGGSTVIMIGDGINDSPALSCADVSVAMRDASDLAREVADVSLLSADLRDLAVLRRISAALIRRVDSNYKAIVGFNGTLLLLAATGSISPSVSAFLHNASTTAFCIRSGRALLPEHKEIFKN